MFGDIMMVFKEVKKDDSKKKQSDKDTCFH